MGSILLEIDNIKAVLAGKREEQMGLEKQAEAYREKASDIIASPTDYADEGAMELMFKEQLDDMYGEFFGHAASDVLKDYDSIQYEHGLSVFIDGIQLADVEEFLEENPDSLEEEADLLDDEAYELELEIEDLESQLEDLEAELEDQE